MKKNAEHNGSSIFVFAVEKRNYFSQVSSDV